MDLIVIHFAYIKLPISLMPLTIFRNLIFQAKLLRLQITTTETISMKVLTNFFSSLTPSILYLYKKQIKIKVATL